MYNDKCIKTKIKICYNKIHTNFQYNKIPKDGECCACLSVTLLDSIVVNANKNCYLQIFLEEFKYALKKKKMINTINEELNLDESDDDDHNYANRGKYIYEQ